MKKIFMLLIGIVIFTISISSINAEEVLSEVEFNKLMENHVFNLNTNTAEEIIEQKRIAEIEELSRLRQRSGGSRSISIPYESQINNYYCGPASVEWLLGLKVVQLRKQQLVQQCKQIDMDLQILTW